MLLYKKQPRFAVEKVGEWRDKELEKKKEEEEEGKDEKEKEEKEEEDRTVADGAESSTDGEIDGDGSDE